MKRGFPRKSNPYWFSDFLIRTHATIHDLSQSHCGDNWERVYVYREKESFSKQKFKEIKVFYLKYFRKLICICVLCMTGVLKNCPAYCSQVFFTFWRYITAFVALILFLGVNCKVIGMVFTLWVWRKYWKNVRENY